ncbi:MAG TPA: bifunctional 3-(3-hydroxy-phenyl)propionate/3-hydroxycinnamic acid hydroxylase [Mycobacterium sp.]|nr:bifunctional 3-(3-hydroxy-phenyl)propionate/3-hydroxycinnamic acid hydroxylase [Mycobacterium sp.]
MNKVDVSTEMFDVAIIGYGPTGLALAYWLGRAGHKTVVVDRWPELYSLPRAGHVDGEIMRLFQRMGMGEEIAGNSSVTKVTVVRDCDGEVLTSVPAEESDQGWEAHYSLFQPHLERALDARVRATGNVTVLQGWQAENIERRVDKTVKVSLAEGIGVRGVWGATGATMDVSARWLIGADGANSVVADFIDSTPEDLGYKARALVIFAERLDPTVGADMPDSEVGMNLTRPYVALRESGKRFARWEFMVHEHESTADMSAPEVAWKLIAPWGFTPDGARLVRHSVFEFRTILAEKWRDANILLAGDAAHRMPPHQGQGMCSGQRDAVGLAWRLDLVLRGVADGRLLDSYMEERRPHVRQLTINSAERGQQFWLTDPESGRQRDARMREGLLGDNLNKSYGAVPALTEGVLMKDVAGVVAPAGQLSPQFEVSVAGRRTLLDDVVGNGWLLIVRDAAALELLSSRANAAMQQISAYVWVADGQGPDDGPQDVDSSYNDWLDRLGLHCVLIRPDCYIFGGARDAEEMNYLSDSLLGQLHLNARLV